MIQMGLDPRSSSRVPARLDAPESKKNTAPSTVLLDIEGTITSISFVADVLFPFARAHVQEYLAAHIADPEIVGICLSIIEVEHGRSDPSVIGEALVHSTCDCVYSQMDRDLKSGPLKQLQGRIWEEGYTRGHFQGHLFPDVLEALQSWNRRGIRVCIYSSGSVSAQKLLLKYSVFGDLTSLVEGHFDTSIGGKKEASSYTKIAQELGVSPDSILFATDNVDEAIAAQFSGMKAVVMHRPGNPELKKGFNFKIAQSTFDLAI